MAANDMEDQPGKLRTVWRELTGSPYGISRAVNAAIVALQRKLRTEYLVGMPTHIAIEVTNRCNGTCMLCPVAEGRHSRPLGHISWKAFRKLVDEISAYARFVGLYNWGEPLLHRRIYDMIYYVKARRIYTKISTNLHAFHARDAERLVETGLDDLAISLHGTSEESYQAYQPHHRLDGVLRKIKAIAEARSRLGSKTPNIHLGFIVNRHNEREIGKLRQLAESLDVDFYLEHTSLNLRLLPFDRNMNRREAGEAQLCRERLASIENWLPRNGGHVFSWYQYIRDHDGRLPPVGKWYKCIAPWYQTIICWDGDVNLCCGSFDRRHSVGNVFEESVRKVWNSRLYQAARRSIRNRRRSSDPWVLCNQCPGILL